MSEENPTPMETDKVDEHEEEQVLVKEEVEGVKEETAMEVQDEKDMKDDDDDDDVKEDDDKKDDDASSQDSAKESVESDESSFHASDYENDAGFDPDLDPTELIVTATSLKEEGNEFFKNGDLIRASRAYKKGVSILKPINKENTGDAQVKSLIVTLSNNLSMLCLQQGKPKLSLDVATKAIQVDDTNCKAYYRRAMAYKKLGMFKEAKKDLKDAYKCDPDNKTVKKELHALVKYMTDTAKREKAAAEAAFSFHKNTTSLYEDKREEQLLKKQEEERKKEEEQEVLDKRKQEWEDECVHKMAKGEDAVTYDDWDKARKKEDKAIRKAKKVEDRRLAEEKKEQEERKRAERAAKMKKKAEEAEEEDDDDDDKLTESELAQFRGYKKTVDGKTTSYFSREQSEHEKKLLGDITPQRLDENGDSTSGNPVKLAPNDLTTIGKGKASAWNAGGATWEEKDATDWVNTKLQFRLMESISKEAPLVGVITKVDDLTGEASVAVAGGRKQYIFDYHCNLDFEIKDEDVDEVVASGTLCLPDINSTNHDDFEVELPAWTKSPSDEFAEKAKECRKALVKAVRVSVIDFVEDFNGHY
jgi:tetratricopeptide (TPR) repeat protein